MKSWAPIPLHIDKSTPPAIFSGHPMRRVDSHGIRVAGLEIFSSRGGFGFHGHRAFEADKGIRNLGMEMPGHFLARFQGQNLDA
jgi:hypothetical protein